MKGFVDNKLRALVRVAVSASSDDVRKELDVWIDTAFNGTLVLPRNAHCEIGIRTGIVRGSYSGGRTFGRTGDVRLFFSIGLASPTRRKSLQTTASILCSVRCYWTATA